MTIDADVLAAVDRIFAERITRGTAPSTVWGVFDADGLVASGGHGDRGDGTAPDADTVYRIASCTKSFTAAAVLLLVRQGALALDDPITRWVPAFADVPLPTPDAVTPTIRMLLTMSAGFPTDDPWADRQESIADDDLDAVLRAGLLFDSTPGTRFAYSNLGYALLGRAIAAASGVPYRDVVSAELLAPLALRRTGFTPPEEGFVVTGVRPHDGGWEPLPLSGPGAFSSIGGLFSTVRDLSTWARFLQGGFAGDASGASDPALPGGAASDQTGPGGAAAPPTRLAAADRRLMQQGVRMIPTTGSRPSSYGLGLVVELDPVHGAIASHTGGYPGFSAHMRWSVERGLGVVAFENATAARVPLAAVEAHDLLLASVGAPDRAAAVLPATERAADHVSELLAAWDDDLADRVFTPNVALDVPYERRRRAIAQAFDLVGAEPSGPRADRWSEAPTHLGWTVQGSRGVVRIQFRLAPLAAGLVQTLLVEAVPAA